MSSGFTRSTLERFLHDNWDDTDVFVVDDADDISMIPANTAKPWVGIEYLTSTEEVDCLPANMWRERGTILLHIVIPNGWVSSTAITLGDKLQRLLRGQRLDELVIQSVSPVISTDPPAIPRTSAWQGFCLISQYQSIRS
jgi:hypothetical protein